MDKNYSVKFIDQSLNESLKKLKTGKTQEKGLYELIVRGIEQLKKDPTNSIIIKKKQIPKIYIQKYKIDNLRLLKLNQEWRLIYTIASNEIQIVSIVLDWFNHKEYEKKFNYKVK